MGQSRHENNLHSKTNCSDHEGEKYLKLEEFHDNNYQIIEIWLGVSQVRTVKDPLRDAHNCHHDEFVS